MHPVTSENEWLAYLGEIPIWKPPLIKTIVLSPHPDDETLGAGGLIFDLNRLVELKVVAITNGEKAYKNKASTSLGKLRVIEQQNALHCLGVKPDQVIRLSLPDSSVTLCEQSLYESLMSIIDSDVHLISPWIGDFHPDHEAVGRVAKKIADIKGIKLTYYFFWTWHKSSPSDLDNYLLKCYPIPASTLLLKQKALEQHQSQLFDKSNHPILPANLLLPMKRPYEVYLPYET